MYAWSPIVVSTVGTVDMARISRQTHACQKLVVFYIQFYFHFNRIAYIRVFPINRDFVTHWNSSDSIFFTIIKWTQSFSSHWRFISNFISNENIRMSTQHFSTKKLFCDKIEFCISNFVKWGISNWMSEKLYQTKNWHICELFNWSKDNE